MQVPPAQQAPPRVAPPAAPDNTLRNVVLGCGCLSLVASLAAALVIYLVISGASKLATNVGASLATLSATQAIDDSRFSDEQKKKFREKIEAVQNDMIAGKMTFEKTSSFAEKVSDSPLLPAATMDYVDEHYLKTSGLNDEEKANAKKTLGRIVRCLVEEKIDEFDLDEILEPLAAPHDEKPGETMHSNTERLKRRATDDELRAFLKQAEELADDSGIKEPLVINIPEEFNKAIDKALAESK